MEEYTKIQSVFKRDETTHKFLEEEFSLPEFEYLRDNIWVFTEKIDGTNIRVAWDPTTGVEFGGRTNNAQIPTFLYAKLQQLFPIEKFQGLYSEMSMVLYGEGYGARVQKGGGNYISDGVDFMLFDVRIDKWWLERQNLEDIADKLSIKVVPIVGEGTLGDAVCLLKGGLQSTFGDFQAEGIVLKPKVELQSRAGHRIITKMKHKDF